MAYIIKCPLPDEVAKKQLEIAALVRANPVKGAHTQRMVDATVLMAETVLDYFFTRPMDMFKTGSVVRMMVNQGIKTGVALISKGSKKWYGGMEADQLLNYADYVESLVAKDE